jgi:hypothetical protein
MSAGEERYGWLLKLTYLVVSRYVGALKRGPKTMYTKSSYVRTLKPLEYSNDGVFGKASGFDLDGAMSDSY